MKCPSSLLLIAVATVTAAPAAFAAVCPIGFTAGTAIADTAIDGTVGAEWNDAQILQSSDPCLASLPDWNGTSTSMDGHAAPSLSKTVRVRSKRDATHLYVAFEVGDQTRNLDGGPLPLGELVTLQIDPNGSRGGQLENGASALAKDYRLDVLHSWGPSLDATTFYDSTTAPGMSTCGVQDWHVRSPPSGLVVGYSTAAGGYAVEVKIPTGALGLGTIDDDTGDLGFAFAVVNDLGHCVSVECDATGIAFPDVLPLTNVVSPLVSDPLDPTGCGDWLVPANWATGYLHQFPGDVWISRQPASWLSEDVDGLACGVVDNSYYPANPCKLAIRGCLRNSTAVDQLRNVLYLEGEHGIGPVTWKVVELKEAVTVAPGGPHCTDSAETTDVAGLTGHPCVRVYILPATFDPDFDRTDILAISSDTDLMAMVAAYDLGTQHIAQQNITRRAEASVCPDGDCRIAGRLDRERTGIAVASLGPPERLFEPAAFGAADQELPDGGRRDPAPADGAMDRGRRPAPTGDDVDLVDEEVARYAGDHVIVQITGYGFSASESARSPRYHFIEEIGGVVELIPVTRFMDDREEPGDGGDRFPEAAPARRAVTFAFQVSNPGTRARTIYLHLDVHAPPGFEDFEYFVDTAPRLYQPGETRTFEGEARPPAAGTAVRHPWSLSVHLGQNDPRGDLWDGCEGDLSWGLDLEYRFDARWAAELFYGHEDFDCPSRDEGEVRHLSLNGKAYLLTGFWRPFVGLGIGGYDLSPGPTETGGNLFVGLQANPLPNLGVEATARYHLVQANGTDADFLTYRLGLRFRF